MPGGLELPPYPRMSIATTSNSPRKASIWCRQENHASGKPCTQSISLRPGFFPVDTAAILMFLPGLCLDRSSSRWLRAGRGSGNVIRRL